SATDGAAQACSHSSARDGAAQQAAAAAIAVVAPHASATAAPSRRARAIALLLPDVGLPSPSALDRKRCTCLSLPRRRSDHARSRRREPDVGCEPIAEGGGGGGRSRREGARQGAPDVVRRACDSSDRHASLLLREVHTLIRSGRSPGSGISLVATPSHRLRRRRIRPSERQWPLLARVPPYSCGAAGASHPFPSSPCNGT